MVVSSKKKKGKQRKAAVLAAAANGSGGSSSSNKIVAKVKSGDNKVTKKLLTAEGQASLSIISLQYSGIVSSVLDLLKRCETDTFEGVMSSVGGDLRSPLIWIKVLIRASFIEPSCCSLQIAENIGPLVRCMINDTERKFFKSNKLWREGIAVFVQLILDVISVSIDENSADWKNVVNTLLRHEGLLTSIVQWGHWREHRPDILKELKGEDYTYILNMSREHTAILINDAWQRSEEDIECIERLAIIGSAPLVSKRYDVSSMLSYTSELIQHVLTEDWERSELRTCCTTLLVLINEVDCVDKAVITKLIGFGSIASDYEIAEHVAKLSLLMLIQKPHMNPCDARVAFAIRSGLIDMCLGFIGRFGVGSVVLLNFDLLDHIEQVFKLIYEISLHQKTAKAVRSKRQQIEDKLVCLEQHTDITKPQSKRVLGMLRSVLDISGRFCCQCNKSLTKTEVLECNGCHRMTYCSRACQREDWLNGHNVTCCKSYIDEKLGQFQGRIHPIVTPKGLRAASQLEELEINTRMVQLKLLLDNSDTIFAQAKGLDLPLHDCIVKFDLRECPPLIETTCYTELYDTPDKATMFEKSRSKENITITYCSYFYSGDVKDVLIMQRFFPHVWLMKQSK